MTKKTTKKAVLLSALTLLVCCSMLIGTTFAWFTDSVSTGNNKIVAGNLDIELYVDGNLVEDDTELFLNDKGEAILWEPGVIAVQEFEVRNVGNLALKYDMYLNVTDKNTLDDHSLAEVIKVAVVDDDTDLSSREAVIAAVEDSLKAIDSNVAHLEGKALEKETSEKFTVVAYWEPTNHDNDYNVNNGQKVDKYKDNDENNNYLYIDFAVTLAATQYTSETDAFDDQYDKDAYVGIAAVTNAIEQGAQDANEALLDTTNGLIYFDDDLFDDDGATAINLNFNEGSKEFILNAFDAISALIVDAVDAQAANIYSIEIGYGLPAKLAELGISDVETNVRVLNGEPVNYDGEYDSWVYEDLGKLLTKAVPSGTLSERMQMCIEFTAEEGLDVKIVDMNGIAQVYRMYFVVDEAW